MGRRSRKRTAPPCRAAPRAGARARRPRRRSSRRARLDEAPKPPWHPFPLVELSILLGMVLVVLGVRDVGRPRAASCSACGFALISVAGARAVDPRALRRLPLAQHAARRPTWPSSPCCRSSCSPGCRRRSCSAGGLAVFAGGALLAARRVPAQDRRRWPSGHDAEGPSAGCTTSRSSSATSSAARRSTATCSA